MSDAASQEPGRSIPEWSWIVLVLILILDVWWRGHTFGPTVVERTELQFWPVVTGESEPLDCDEAAYGYIGRRISEGAVMYRDLVENKPPLGYWLYAGAITMGGPTELTVRILPIPMVLATIMLLWWLGHRLASAWAGCLAAFLYVILSTDPYLFGNGSNLEHAMNLFSVASLAAIVAGWGSPGRFRWLGWIALAGLLVGAASLVKQVAAVVGLVYAVGLWLHRDASGSPRAIRARLAELAVLALGFVVAWTAAILVLVVRGAGPAAFEAIVRFGSAMATDTPKAPKAPMFLVRWLTGNSDPRTGALPWPFGQTDWLHWWGAGSWPLWLAAVPGLFWLARRGSTGPRRLVAAWTLAAWIQVALPGLFWAHYYLLPTPGVALAVGILTAELASRFREAMRGRKPPRRLMSRLIPAAALLAAIVATAAIQTRDYLLVKSEDLVRYNGGYQWVRLREIGRLINFPARLENHASLFVWGWQSNLYFYSGLDSPSRHFFTNDLMKAFADRPHPVVSPWIEEIMTDLRAHPPTWIFTGDPPFPALRAFLQTHYQVSRLVPEAPVLWVEKSQVPRLEPQPLEYQGWEHHRRRWRRRHQSLGPPRPGDRPIPFGDGRPPHLPPDLP